jgi:hypothetical protein
MGAAHPGVRWQLVGSRNVVQRTVLLDALSHFWPVASRRLGLMTGAHKKPTVGPVRDTSVTDRSRCLLTEILRSKSSTTEQGAATVAKTSAISAFRLSDCRSALPDATECETKILDIHDEACEIVGALSCSCRSSANGTA